MSCNGCRTKVEQTLQQIGGITSASVTLEPSMATIEMEQHIPTETMQSALSEEGNYHIEMAHGGKMKYQHKLRIGCTIKAKKFPVLLRCETNKKNEESTQWASQR